MLRDSRQLVTGVVPSVDRWTLAQLVVALAGLAAWLAFALLVVSTLVTIVIVPLERLGASLPMLVRLTGPPWLRRAVIGACGLSLAAPVAAHAAPDHEQSPDRCDVVCLPDGKGPSLLAGLAYPDLPDLARSHAESSRVRVVRRGDSLWSIARAELPPSASDAAVCREVSAIYAANRALIGPDPDLILPGTELIQPGGTP